MDCYYFLNKVMVHDSRPLRGNPNDKVYTPDYIVDEVLSVFKPLIGPSDTLLEPFLGEGAFYSKMPKERTEWCEIDLGVDFFEYEKQIDWIITNPPYSNFKQILLKCLEVANNVVLVIPTNKVLSSMPRLMDINRLGFGIQHIHYLGSGRQLKFPFGFPVGAVYLKRGFVGPTVLTYEERCYQAKHKGA